MRFTLRVLRGVACVGLAIALLGRGASAIPIATIAIEPDPGGVVAPGGVAMFDVYLRDYIPDASTDAIIAFALDISASDSALTGGGTDFSRFSFALSPGLTGIIGSLVFDGDMSDDGRVEYGADIPPLGTETGILESMGDLLLGTLSVLAPTTEGTYSVALALDSVDPLFQTFLLIDDGSVFGATLPGDGDLTLLGSSFAVQGAQVVPEPSSLLLAGMGFVLCLGALSQRSRKRIA